MTSSAHGQTDFKRLRLSLGLIAGFMFVEIVAGFLTGSLALLSDAAHMGADALGLGMALAAIAATRRRHPVGHTFGLYRLEILAALANTLLLLVLAGYVMVEAIGRLAAPTPINVGPMLVVALAGLVVNMVSLRLLQGHSLNIRAARAEVAADLAASVGVVVAAGVIAVTGWAQADLVVALVVSVLIIPRAFGIGRQALRIILQAAPPELDLQKLRLELEQLPGVVDLHDFHVWTLTSGMEVASAHLRIEEEVDAHVTLDRARGLLQESYGIAHATLQIESRSHRSCVEIEW